MKIRILPPEEARKIAAGEVVDRPASLVRELLDNAIDAGSGFIETSIDDGGIRKIEVIDDGCGMGKEDLELCYYAHATSKIQSLEDLDKSETLGFRGEALAAAASVAKLDILTSTDGREAWRLEAGPGESRPPTLERARRVKGSSVRCFDLFDTIPARKRFLKRDWSEANLCYQSFVDKALAFPEIGFRFIQNSKVKTMLPSAPSLKERFASLLLEKKEADFLYEIATQGEGFSINIVVGGAELARSDRKKQYLFANGRRIQDFSLLTALEYGVQGSFPNGSHPVGAVFIDIAPHLADFNIHPAKREARFSDSSAIHHAITSALKDFCRHQRISIGIPSPPYKNGEDHESKNEEKKAGGIYGRFSFEERGKERYQVSDNKAAYQTANTGRSMALEALLEKGLEKRTALPGRKTAFSGRDSEMDADSALKYLGRAFDLFIIVEKGERLFLIDQHAAHERMLYEEFISKPIPSQELLVSISFRTESKEDDLFLEKRKADLARLGVLIEKDGEGWNIEALPSSWSLGYNAVVKEVLGLRSAGGNIAERWAATLACHSAVKDREFLDETAALALAESALNLPEPFCPHGRPLWLEISRNDLFKAVKRT